VEGNYAYVADGSNGLVIVDVSDPAAPTLKGSYYSVRCEYRLSIVECVEGTMHMWLMVIRSCDH